ncbi:acetylornithine deacetylase [Hyphobacterium sp. HN65]|uniref:Acetylornithine deacetylase n=1 Tax=Hyphobacterium lacteum TaxID=3116575 RepID=A0ABU7LPV8_9PROT|nr:acetylornithine deacetylase [Hyphobacterium sp. HN65]MEE2525646.1 acetylornithine deacetylase [Hyphobacterium sp. HN65]
MTAQSLNKVKACLADLIAMATVSRDSNLQLIGYLEDRLTALGARCFRTSDATHNKANLHAILGPDTDGGVVLSGHTDVVPVDDQDWSSDPFEMIEMNGRLFGRGTCDMKGFIACALVAAEDYARLDLDRPVHFAFSYDEEVGCLGAPDMIREMTASGPQPAIAIIGEPTGMKVVTGHKGLYSVEVVVEGLEAHSSKVEDGACAVTHAVPLMQYLVDAADAWKAAAPADSPFEPPYGTITIGEMSGGTALNILARKASFGSLMRPAPWDDAREVGAELRRRAAAVQEKMRRHAPEARVEVFQRSDAPPLRPEDNGAAEELARRLTGDNAKRYVSFGTEAGQFQSAGLSTVVCGPGYIEQAHKPDEFVDISQLEACLGFLNKLPSFLMDK